MTVLLIWASICISICKLKCWNANQDPEWDCWTLSRRSDFEALDKDEDGLVSVDEYKATSIAVGLQSWADLAVVIGPMFDFDKDGGLNFEEYLMGFYQ